MFAALVLLAVNPPFWETTPWPGPSPKCPEPPITVKILVVNYDPVIESEGGRRLHDVLGWDDPRALAKGYIADIERASGGFVRQEIVEWRDLDEWPRKVDGFRYDDESFLKLWGGDRSTAHQPDEADFPFLCEDQKIPALIDAGKVDEVWVFSFPYAGHWEASMAGPGAFFINGGVYPQVPTKKPFAIMGFSYEREVDEMIHNLCHRTENVMRRAYGRWEPGVPTNLWEQFSAFEQTSPGHAAVGNCHFPPNGEKDYDYANPRTVESAADEWLAFPNLTGVRKPVDKDTWGGPEYQLQYLRWWFTRLPKAPGVQADGRQNNWWKYIYRFNDFDENGLPAKAGN